MVLYKKDLELNSFFLVITKTGSGREQPEMTKNHLQTTTNYQQTTTNYQQVTKNGHPYTLNQKTEVFFFFHPVITRTTSILKNIGNQLGNTVSFFHSTCVKQEKYNLLALVGLVASIPTVNKKNQLFF